MKGFINVYKPEGLSSAMVVGVVKKKFHCPAGHMGTLDPMAEGVLPIGLDKTSRLFPYLLNKTKTYVADFKFGIETDTLDITGKELCKCDIIPNKEQILAVLPKLVGDIDQIPPKYSAKCVNGKRGYELARRGIEFELKPKKVTIYNIELNNQIDDNTFRFTVDCSGGTYIRSIVRDMAQLLGTKGIMSRLIRTKSGGFSAENAVKLETLVSATEEQAKGYVIPSDFPLSFDKLYLQEEQAKKILNGVFNNYGFKNGKYSVYLKDEFWGVGTVVDGVLKIDSYVRENS
ncbi:MAG: tRNA pseudouridine(55) synthase TruB [Clostridia bacterium]|nr:tRNA pseudouridine(55) synthase TruB [Clostridia bacterium]